VEVRKVEKPISEKEQKAREEARKKMMEIMEKTQLKAKKVKEILDKNDIWPDEINSFVIIYLAKMCVYDEKHFNLLFDVAKIYAEKLYIKNVESYLNLLNG
jgi:hypothetical protein